MSTSRSGSALREAIVRVWDCALAGSPVVYLSGPITTGLRYVQQLKRGASAGVSAEWVRQKNIDELLSTAKRLRRQRREIVIEPASLHLPEWSQTEYHRLWEQLIERHIRLIIFIPGWEYSFGCALEFAHASTHDIRTEALSGAAISIDDGIALLVAARDDLRGRDAGGAFAGLADQLDKVIGRLEQLISPAKIVSQNLRKDASLDLLAERGMNVAQFVSFSPENGKPRQARQLGMRDVPTIELGHLTGAERRAYVIADNRLAELAGWDREILAIELQALSELDLDFELEITGFETAELDLLLDGVDDADSDEADQMPEPGPSVTRAGDIWLLGRHRLICGDAREATIYTKLMADERTHCVFTDPPYNVKIDGHVCGSGAIRHREFAMASGEMDAATFTGFLEAALGAMADVSKDGAIHFVCMDWRHMRELQAAGSQVYSELKNLVVWKKSNGGMGSFYRSQHELVFVYKVGTAAHTNTFGLGDTGRYRTNVWEYPGVNSFGPNQSDLALHPTVKPVALVADAIKDASRRGEIVLDGFGGSGTTLIAAERTGRTARLVELDPHYCDVICRRFEAFTGASAQLAEIRRLAEADRWVTELRDGKQLSEIACRTGHSGSYIRIRAQLAFLSPRIQAAILDGSQPPELSLERIVRTGVPLDWSEQERVFGFSA